MIDVKAKKMRFLSVLLILSALLALAPRAAAANGPEAPAFHSQRAIVVDFNTGEVYYEKNADQTGQCASMTKLMTTYLVFEDMAAGKFTAGTEAPIGRHAAEISASYQYSGVHSYKEGDKVPVDTLIKLALVPSCCASAIALGEYISPDGTEQGTVARMNEKAAEWGIDAHFSDCAGLVDEGNAVSPRAMSEIACRYLRDYPQVLQYTSLPSVTYGGTEYASTNALLGGTECPGIDGLKSGFTTPAGYCFTGTAERNGVRIVCVGMKADSKEDRTADTRDLLNYGFARAQAKKAAALAGTTAYASTQTVTVDGKPTEFQMYALRDAKGNPTNYIKVRDLAFVLNGTRAQFEVSHDAAAKTVDLTTGAPYTPNGSEMKTPFSGDRTCSAPVGGTRIDGNLSDLAAIQLTGDTGGGFTYYRLRDLGRVLGFQVDWSKEKGIFIETCEPGAVNYANAENWAFLETETTDKAADVFFVCPTVYGGREGGYNMALDDEKARSSFVGATNMEKGIYDDDARFFAPYYRQAGLKVYAMPAEEREPYLASAYQDVKEAFSYYLEYYNEGRPIVLAGFSQGGDMCLRLVKDFQEAGADRLVACYAIGWSVSAEELAEHPGLAFAQGESDTGVIVSFNTEARDITDSMLIPAGTRTLAINPLNWKTDGTVADKSLNLGACFTNYAGEIETEIPALTGAYIDGTRGALKAPDVTPEEYPAGLNFFQDGVYHLYDYQFFYRNLEKNVQDRIKAFGN